MEMPHDLSKNLSNGLSHLYFYSAYFFSLVVPHVGAHQYGFTRTGAHTQDVKRRQALSVGNEASMEAR
jgi:hypothetical protein